MESGGSSGRAVDNQLRGPRFDSQIGPSQIFIASLCLPSTKWPSFFFRYRPSGKRLELWQWTWWDGGKNLVFESFFEYFHKEESSATKFKTLENQKAPMNDEREKE
ncbi:hypothetical protein PoB_006082200 [Plakobranchus ocellatus]|uniref:Uncharacterized protein n=1 Tax=Plakobranchus ocellatus TaxID=259542 RepID=A0AAV4CR18_9GAST|nr:hypothetical protein PoB_006082200 [Plakobranchus ocellatus]